AVDDVLGARVGYAGRRFVVNCPQIGAKQASFRTGRWGQVFTSPQLALRQAIRYTYGSLPTGRCGCAQRRPGSVASAGGGVGSWGIGWGVGAGGKTGEVQVVA